jgi:hypothetical protein
MGSKQALSNGNEPEEVTDLIAAFEQQNKCKIILTCLVELTKGYLDCRWTAEVVDSAEFRQEAEVSALRSVSVWAGDYKTLMGVVTRLLYALDFQLALNEFERTLPNNA